MILFDARRNCFFFSSQVIVRREFQCCTDEEPGWPRAGQELCPSLITSASIFEITVYLFARSRGTRHADYPDPFYFYFFGGGRLSGTSLSIRLAHFVFRFAAVFH